MSDHSPVPAGIPDLKAGDFTLRALAPEDATALHRHVNDWNVIRMLSQLPFPYPHDLAVRWIASTREQAGKGEAWHFAITDETGALAGCIGLTTGRDSNPRKISIGYWLGSSFRGRGIATLATRRVCQWAFAHLPIDSITATVAQDNLPSIAVLRRNGFRETGTGTRPFMARGGDIPVFTFEADRTAFEAAAPDTAASRKPAAAPSASGRRLVLVVAAALIDSDNRVLLARRPEGKALAGLWEFPGGKTEPGETPEAALIRELKEELGIDVSQSCLAPFTFVSHPCDSFDLLMPLWLCRRWSGTPEGREGQALAWVRAEDLEKYPMPPADIPLIPFLRDLL